MNYHPPPLFKQGTSARVKVVLFSLLAIFLLIADARLHSLTVVRQTLGSVLYPLQLLTLMPRDALHNVSDYFTQVSTLKKDNAQLKHMQLMQAQELQQGRQLQQENAHLRRLLGASEHLGVPSLAATILYDARDSFNRRIIVDRGTNHGVALGQPVIDDQGVVGQVTRVFPLTAEVTLLNDKDQVIPVQVQRNGLRGVLYGKGQIGNLEMRLPSNTDIKVGDILVTSGIDGLYPSGLSVARVTAVNSDGMSPFERIVSVPLAGLEHHEEVLVLLIDTQINVQTKVQSTKEEEKPQKINRRITRDSAAS